MQICVFIGYDCSVKAGLTGSLADCFIFGSSAIQTSPQKSQDNVEISLICLSLTILTLRNLDYDLNKFNLKSRIKQKNAVNITLVKSCVEAGQKLG